MAAADELLRLLDDGAGAGGMDLANRLMAVLDEMR